MQHAGDPRRCRVLVVEDDENLRYLVQATLGSTYEVLLAGSAAAARATLAAEAVDLLVLDLHLGQGESGWTVCESLAPLEKAPPVILVTGSSAEADQARAEAFGVCAYLQKPYSPLQLLETVQASLQPS